MNAPQKLDRPLTRIRSDELEWEVLGTHGLRRKVLGHDPQTGHVTSIVGIPVGWRGGGIAHFHEGFEEVLMLEGSVTLDGSHYWREGDYFYRPAQVVHGHDERSEEGALALVRSNGLLALELVHSPDQAVEYPLSGQFDPRGHVFNRPLASVKPVVRDGFPGGWTIQPLSEDPQSGASTIAIRIPAGWSGNAPALGVAWEAFVMAGAVHGSGLGYSAGDYSVGEPQTPLLDARSSPEGAHILVWQFGHAE